MRLIDLHPEFQRVNVDDNNIYELTFDCPVCRAPWRVHVKVRLGGPSGPVGIWSWTASPFSNIPPVPLDWNTVTIKPSVQFSGFNAHGKKRECFAHFNIENGEVILS